MASQLTQLRVFLATPGGLDAERKLFRDTLRDFNEDFAHHQGFVFVVEGWEQATAGTGRPQGKINNMVRSCDYLVVLIWDRWGTATSANPRYTSGTQEEMAVALECLRDPNQEMRDIAVFFKAVDERHLSDPGPQLAQVLEFKDTLEASSTLFFQMFDTSDDLRRHLQRLISYWIRDFGDKVPREVSVPGLPPSVETRHEDDPEPDQPTKPLDAARALADSGHLTRAEQAYASAIATNQRESLIAYAKFLRRTGRLQRAFEINERILDLEDTSVGNAQSSATDRASILANMGVIRRKQGRLTDSRRYLEDAVRTASTSQDSERLTSEAFALDNLGITLRRLGDRDEALKTFDAALRRRERPGDEVGRAKTLLNIAKLQKDQDQLHAARVQAGLALDVLKKCDGERRTLANAYTTLGDISCEEGNLLDAYTYYDKSLELNEAISHSDGIAIVSNQLAQLNLILDRIDKALPYANRSLSENLQSGNKEGEAIALRTLGHVMTALGEHDDARRYFQRAAAIFIQHQNLHDAIEAKIGLAELLAVQGKDEEARGSASEAFSLAQLVTVNSRTLDRIARLLS